MLLHFLTELGCEIQTMALLRCLLKNPSFEWNFSNVSLLCVPCLINDFLGNEFLKFHCFEIKERVMHAASYTPLEIAVVLWGVLHLYEGNLGKKDQSKGGSSSYFSKMQFARPSETTTVLLLCSRKKEKRLLQTLLTDFSSCPINLSQESPPSRTNDHLEDRASGLSQQVFKAFGFYTWKKDSKTPPTFCLVIKTRLKSILVENAS